MISVIIPGLSDRRDGGGEAGARSAARDPGMRTVVCRHAVLRLQLHGPELTDIMSSLTCIVVMVLVLKLWTPKNIMRLEGRHGCRGSLAKHHGAVRSAMAWVPYLLLVVFVLVVGRHGYQAPDQSVGRRLDSGLPGRRFPVRRTRLWRSRLAVPGLHNLITRIPPVVAKPAPYAALYELNWLSASGTACFLAILADGARAARAAGQVVKAYVDTFKQLKLAILTIACMLGLAYLMNYSGMTSTLGLALATTGVAFPFFSAVSGGSACSSPAATRRRTRSSETCRW